MYLFVFSHKPNPPRPVLHPRLTLKPGSKPLSSCCCLQRIAGVDVNFQKDKVFAAVAVFQFSNVELI